jgi:hypothetical protein
MGADKNSSRSPTRLPTHISDSLPKLAKPTHNLLIQNTPTHTAETCTACCLCRTGQTDGLRRSDRWTASVGPVATAAAQQSFQKASVTSLGPGTKPPPKYNLHRRKTLHKPNKITPNRPRTDQQHHDSKTHESSSSPEANPTKDLHR